MVVATTAQDCTIDHASGASDGKNSNGRLARRGEIGIACSCACECSSTTARYVHRLKQLGSLTGLSLDKQYIFHVAS